MHARPDALTLMPTLSARLRQETRALHTDAERSPFMTALLKGRLDRTAYGSLLQNLSRLYVALEGALEQHQANPALSTLDWKRYARRLSLDRDLATLGDVAGDEPPQPATRLYVERLSHLADQKPELLLAHAYVRYLGDLSGGQLLARIVVASPAIGRDVGTAFYDFGEPSDVARLSSAFREGLDRADVSDSEALVAEAQDAFVRHRSLFDQLFAAHPIPVTGPTSA